LVHQLLEQFVELRGFLEMKFDGVETRLDRVETRLDRVEIRLTSVDGRLSVLEREFAQRRRKKRG
jgi:chromosome segregation ATPase